MGKLALKIEDLAVETFQTVSEAPARGTVNGAADTIYDAGCATAETACPDFTCRANSQCCPSAINTCARTCLRSCYPYNSCLCPNLTDARGCP